MPRTGPTICAACAEVSTLPGHNEPHKYMRIVGQHSARYPNGGYDTNYKCLECETVWVCHTDKWGYNNGFKLLPQVR